MQVFYEFEVNATEAQLKEMFSEETEVLFKEIKLFILQRWKVLEDETNKYEEAHAVIRLAASPFRVSFLYGHMPMEIAQKLNDSITQEDWDYLAVKLKDVL